MWLTLGQEPNIAALQTLMYVQITGSDFEGDPTAETKQEHLQQAMAGKNLLLVLDDCWESSTLELLNCIDSTTGSKVLVSSRVRSVLEGGEIVDVGLPTEDEAVKILLSAADWPSDAATPAGSKQVAKLAGYLPLTLALAGKIIKGLGVADDWHEVLELMQEEFLESAQERSMEDRVIRTSLRSINGPHRENVLRLFHALAVVPEDTQVPIEVVAMLFEAEADAPALPKPPSLLNIRRYLKVLIDRSLVLGSVDRPSLHVRVAFTIPSL